MASLVRARVAAGAALALGAGLVVAPAGAPPAAAAAAEAFRVPPDGVFSLRGHGWGHGHGMSQYGAYGAAKVKGLDYQQILAFYYPGTTVAGLPLDTNVRVYLHASTAMRLTVAPRDGEKLTASTSVDGVPDCVLPDSLDDGKTPVTQWRARVVSTASGSEVRVQASTDGTTWITHPTIEGCDPAWSAPLDGSVTFDGGGITDLVRSSGIAPYRGALRAAFTGSRVYVVNVVAIDKYLRSVVPSEMPSTWSPAALQAQAVAARTYAAYEMAHPKNAPYYDVYDDTRDQMYLGQHHEAASTTAAVQATEDAQAGTGVVLHDGDGNPAFTQFSSSDGGWTADGGQPYLPAQRDPYDGLVPSPVHSWSASVPASAIARAYVSRIGQLRSIVVTGRVGHGQWGGRITSLQVRGTAGTVELSGLDFRLAFGLRSEWFEVVPPPGPPTEVTATVATGTATVGWQPPVSSSGAAVTGYRVVMRPGGATARVSADARTATVPGLADGTDYTATVAALSSSGRGWGTTVTTKVHRIDAAGRVPTAVAGSRATFADGKARAVVLVRRAGAVADGFGAAPLAAATHASVLLTGRTSLPGATSAEMRRVLPAGGTVYLLGSTSVISDDVRAAVRDLGYHVVRRDGATPAAVARSVARTVARLHDVTTAVEVDTRDPVSAWIGGVVAAHRHGVLLLTGGGAQAPETARWFAHNPRVRRLAVGSAAAAADPAARAFTADSAEDLAGVVAQRLFGSARAAAVVSPSGTTAAAVAAARLAVTRGALLYALPASLPADAASYLSSVRDSLRRVDLVGGSLPYDDVESDVQAALLGR